MCGIFASISYSSRAVNTKLDDRENQISHRGPDKSYSSTIMGKTTVAKLVFHRLSIMGLTAAENSILNEDGVYMICNGEIYKHKNYAERYGLELSTQSDCEVILKMYTKFMNNREYEDSLNIWNTVDYFKDAVSRLDGVFAFVIWDSNKEILIAGRDRIGVRPLYYYNHNNITEFASEEKCLDLSNLTKQFPPANILYQQRGFSAMTEYWTFPGPSHVDISLAKNIINNMLTNSVKKRLVSDRPVGFLLSGGLDSSLIASIASKLLDTPITTFSIGYPDSTDLIAAKKVAARLGSHHHEIIIKDNDIINSLEDLIWCLGGYDVTSIRASMPMYLLSKYISTYTDIKVLFSGEGADELFAGYLYLHKSPSCKDLQDELNRLVKDLYLFDVRRADRTTSRWGLELRVPFLDADFIEFVIALDPYLKMGGDKIEKKILRDSFEGYLPESILYRRKEAFSDGVGSRSVALLKEMAGQSVLTYVPIELNDNFAIPITDEAKFYYNIFKKLFGNFNDTSHYWMPRWSPEVVNDPSATFLSLY